MKICTADSLLMTQKILVTGADGFVGSALSRSLKALGYQVICVARSSTSFGVISVGDVAEYEYWPNLLQGIDCVIHCAARAHVFDEKTADPVAVYRNTNVVATQRLVEAAIGANVRRFVFISSIGVLGKSSNGRGPFTEDDEEAPVEPYTVSKLEAEKIIKALCHKSKMNYVIIRPPLVYGPNAKGNFATLARYVKNRLPLPSGTPQNRRSLVALDNLVSFVALCADSEKSPRAANETFLIADDEVVSTAQLLDFLKRAYGSLWRLPSIPYFLMKLMAKMAGKTVKLERMFDSLEVSSEKARSMLGWKSVVSMQQQLDLIAKHDSNI